MIIDEEEVLLDSAIIAGKILMENGAEMHRIEDTMNRILRGSELVEDAMSFVIPSGIFITGQSGNNTKMKRITKRTTNLQKVALVNDVSRRYAQKNIDAIGLFEELQEIDKNNINTPTWIKNLSAGMISGFMMILFDGNIKDLFVTVFIGYFAYMLYQFDLKGMKVRFLQEFFASFFAVLLALFFNRFGLIHNMDTVIIGSIIILVPGIQIMNSIRDFLVGNTISGTIFMVEAMLIAAMIGAGVLAGFQIL